MRVLWFSPTPSGYSSFSNSHNGAGWISSLEDIVKNVESIELAVAFKGSEQLKKERDGVTYYSFSGEVVPSSLEIIDDYHPDLIQIFGSEKEFGLICSKTRIPVVIYMQGCMSPIHNAQYPPEVNKWSFLFSKGLPLRRRIMGFRTDSAFARSEKREETTLQRCQNYIGRTDWDKGIISLYNPTAKYFHCEEALRDSFLKTEKRWQYLAGEEIRLISVISNPWYKGVDLILKTAELLHKYAHRPFRWEVYGTKDIRFYENKYGIQAMDVNVYVNGSVDKNKLVDKLVSSSLYVHTSYIDNSPNSICEAQYLGVPVLATYVGGIPSLVENGKTGILFPANAPHSLAPLILQLAGDKERCEAMSNEEQIVAAKRHNPDTIRETILDIYKQILSQQ